MFEKALVTRVGSEAGVDLGLLAETIFFYGSTQLLLSSSSLGNLVTAVSPADLKSLLSSGHVKLSFLKDQFAVVTAGSIHAMDYSVFELAGSEKGKKVRNDQDRITMFLERRLAGTKESKRLIQTVVDATHSFRYPRDFTQVELIKSARADLSDQTYLGRAARTALNHLLPGINIGPFRFLLVEAPGGGYLINTDLDFERLNREYHKRIPASHSSLSSEYILTHILDARTEGFFAANYMAELVTAPVTSDLLRLKQFEFLLTRRASQDTIGQFSDISLPGFPSIREAINSGQRSFSDFLRLLDQAEKFKDWLQNTNPDLGMLQEYVRKATEPKFADKLPHKSVRFVLINAVGLGASTLFTGGVAAAAGLGLSLIDTFYLDKLLNGWRPNQFIEGPYKQFVKGSKK